MGSREANQSYHRRKRLREFYSYCWGCERLQISPRVRCKDGFKNPGDIRIVSEKVLCPCHPQNQGTTTSYPYPHRHNEEFVPTPFDIKDISSIIEQVIEDEKRIEEEMESQSLLDKLMREI